LNQAVKSADVVFAVTFASNSSPHVHCTFVAQ
jgi:hypothetical protein